MDHIPSTHCANDDEWSHVRETINMLCLAVCQIEATLADSHSSVTTLTRSFTELANHTSDVSAQIQHLTQPEELATFKDDISATAAEMKHNINASIGAFQFYDRVCQRLDHVARSLEKVSAIMSSGDFSDPCAWRGIQQNIKSSYTMEAEHVMFDYIMRGGSVKTALEAYRQHLASHPTGNSSASADIELF